MNIIVQTFLGLGALVGGVGLLIFFMTGLSTGANFVFLILSLILIGGGAFLFIRVSKIQNSMQNVDESSSKDAKPQSSKLLDKNNQMVKEWTQLNNKKDNLKAVQMAVGAEVQAKTEQQ